MFRPFHSRATSSSAAKNQQSNRNASNSRPIYKDSETFMINRISRRWSWDVDRYNCMDYAIKEKAIDIENLLRTWGWAKSTKEQRLEYWLDENLFPINPINYNQIEYRITDDHNREQWGPGAEATS